MTKASGVPEEDSSFAGSGMSSVEDAGLVVRRSLGTGVQSARPAEGDGGPGAKEQFGDLNRNLTALRYVRDR